MPGATKSLVGRAENGRRYLTMGPSRDRDRDFEYVKLHRARWNLIDMIKIVSSASIPATLFYDIDVSWTEALRDRYAALGYKVTVTAVLLKAIAIAQLAHPCSRTVMLPNGRLIQLNKLEGQFTVEKFVDEQPAVFFGSVKQPHKKAITEIGTELEAYAQQPIADVPQLAIEDRFSRFPWVLRQILIFLGMRIPQLRIRFMGATFGP